MKEQLTDTICLIADATVTMMRGEYENQQPVIYRWDWQPGVGLYGLVRAYEVIGEQRFLGYSQHYVDRLLDADQVSYSINGSMLFEIVLKLYEHTGESRYQTELRYFLRWLLHSAAKCQNGCFEHSWTETNVHLTEQVWIDTLFMAGIVLADAYRLLGAPLPCWSCSSSQRTALRDRHGAVPPPARQGTPTAHGGRVLGRGSGWMAASAVKSWLCGCPRTTRSLSRSKQMNAARAARAGRHVPHRADDPDTWRDAATAALGYAALKGVRLGLLDDDFRDMGEKATQAVLAHVRPDGIVDRVSSGTSGFITYEAYNEIPISPRLYGQALAILLLTEHLIACD